VSVDARFRNAIGIVVVVSALLTKTGLAAVVELSLTIKRDTLLPCEPIYALVVAKNVTSTPISVPHVREGYSKTTFDYSVYSPVGLLAFKSGWQSCPEPSWNDRVLSPGDSTYAVFNVGGGYFEPGTYRVLLGWNSRIRGTAPAWAGGPPSTATFVIRKPDSAEQHALDDFQEISKYGSGSYWFQPEGQHLRSSSERIRDQWKRVESLARRMTVDRDAEPYVVLAEIELMHDYWDRGVALDNFLPGGESPGQWQDSLRAVTWRAFLGHPDSPILEHLLVTTGGKLSLEYIAGGGATTALFRECVRTALDTRVGREAARILDRRSQIQNK